MVGEVSLKLLAVYVDEDAEPSSQTNFAQWVGVAFSFVHTVPTIFDMYH